LKENIQTCVGKHSLSRLTSEYITQIVFSLFIVGL